jgi:putative ABC transport system substrate-binding protein
VRRGSIIAYRTNFADLYRRAAGYVDKILKGAKPGDLPVELPHKYDLIINLKTARMLGVKLPPSILLRATRVIE